MRYLLTLFLTLTAAHAFAQSEVRLADQFDRAYASQNYRLALDAAEAILRREPDSAVWNFNAGRICAVLDDPDQAITRLKRAADLGYSGIATFDDHPDLTTLRDREDFKAILSQVRASAERRRAQFQKHAQDYKPPAHVPRTRAPDEKTPLLIALHGTGGDGQSMLNALRSACDALGIVCVAPDALRPAGAGYSWTFRDEAAWLVRRTVAEAIKEYDTDPARTILLGFSQGANVALAMATDDPAPFTAIIPICGHYETDGTPARRTPPPMCLITGANDASRLTYAQAEKEFIAAGAHVRNRTVPGMGHAIPNKNELIQALKWALDPPQ